VIGSLDWYKSGKENNKMGKQFSWLAITLMRADHDSAAACGL
jgi:hypothetical protein